MNFLTGISLGGWLKIGAVAAFALMAGAFHLRGITIDALRTQLATERAAHVITRASVTALDNAIKNQNAMIDAQRAQVEQGRRDLAIADAASATSQDVIRELASSSRATPAGQCVPSATARKVWK